MRPSLGYERLVEFLHQGLVKTILTTNFDALLSETRVLVRRPHYIDVIQTPSDYTKFSTSPQYPQEVFLHGSVDHYTDKNIIDEVQRLDPDLVIQGPLFGNGRGSFDDRDRRKAVDR